MKLMHLSDLHLGKRLNEFPLLEDQRYILERILQIVDAEKPDAVLIAGDVYDKTLPPADAVTLLDDFLVRLTRSSTKVLMISGNHDSPERLSFAGRLMREQGVHIAPVYDGNVVPVTLEDEYGALDVFLLPFLKPVHMRRIFPNEEIETYTDAVACAVRRMPVDPARRSVLVTHQFVTGAQRCESEELSVGGSDNVDVSVFEPFDYVALGHLHGPQNVCDDRVRYCGTPLKYSFSETHHQKSVTVVDLGEKGTRTVRTIPLHARRDVLEVKGEFSRVMDPAFYADISRDAYVRVILTDENDIYDAVSRLRAVYPNLMRLDYDNLRTQSGVFADGGDDVRRDPLELFADFYEQQNHQSLSEEQRDYMRSLIETIQEEGA